MILCREWIYLCGKIIYTWGKFLVQNCLRISKLYNIKENLLNFQYFVDFKNWNQTTKEKLSFQEGFKYVYIPNANNILKTLTKRYRKMISHVNVYCQSFLFFRQKSNMDTFFLYFGNKRILDIDMEVEMKYIFIWRHGDYSNSFHTICFYFEVFLKAFMWAEINSIAFTLFNNFKIKDETVFLQYKNACLKY